MKPVLGPGHIALASITALVYVREASLPDKRSPITVTASSSAPLGCLAATMGAGRKDSR